MGLWIDLGEVFFSKLTQVPPNPPIERDYTPIAEAMLDGLLAAGCTAYLVRRETHVDDPYEPAQ